jgi:hypothetical protein
MRLAIIFTAFALNFAPAISAEKSLEADVIVYGDASGGVAAAI